ncbi:hypothetical protein AAC03nite_15770 [Alicyclobacillus acidoterrestris]|uniref:stage III sporulation protein AF n=1 Tax=Alicyclobacillus suci TaxID=2816080 RepID=UPI001191CFC1|nr:stage III sporulation protein AF [Alicyclobacillus suci]GEO25792.1 hypothetical protein AAC03nite_15770 [Alicyclobacillus acidoterrestris]
MTMLGEWMKQLIIIVMISIIADMLLPTKAMQKYVRAVLGIAIIAAMIQPITPFFRQDWADKMATAAADEMLKDSSSGADTTSNQSIVNYQHTLETQEASETNTMVADAILESLPKELRAHVVHLAVSNASTPAHLLATVDVDTTNSTVCTQIRQHIKNTLEVSESQVVVRQNGGE